jgi:hypothetical protein
MWAIPQMGLPCLPSNDYYQWPATIIFVLRSLYRNILINVKKKYYILYMRLLCGIQKSYPNRNGMAKNTHLLTNFKKLCIMALFVHFYAYY